MKAAILCAGCGHCRWCKLQLCDRRSYNLLMRCNVGTWLSSRLHCTIAARTSVGSRVSSGVTRKQGRSSCGSCVACRLQHSSPLAGCHSTPNLFASSSVSSESLCTRGRTRLHAPASLASTQASSSRAAGGRTPQCKAAVGGRRAHPRLGRPPVDKQRHPLVAADAVEHAVPERAVKHEEIACMATACCRLEIDMHSPRRLM